MKSKNNMSSRRVENPFQEPLVLIKWVDSAEGCGWQMLSSIQKEAFVCHTFGWAIAETKDAIIVSSTVSKSVASAEQVCGTITIPRVSIISVTYY